MGCHCRRDGRNVRSLPQAIVPRGGPRLAGIGFGRGSPMNDSSTAAGIPTCALPPDPSRELEELWQQGQRPDVRQFLQEAGALTPVQIIGALSVDQWHRWQQGERVPAEVYLQMHPGLAGAQGEAFDLVYGEFLLREELGEQPTIDDFVKRFPQYAAELQRQAKVHDAIESGNVPESTVVHPMPGDLPALTAQQPAAYVSEDWPTVPGYTILAKLGQGG